MLTPPLPPLNGNREKSALWHAYPSPSPIDLVRGECPVDYMYRLDVFLFLIAGYNHRVTG